MNAYRVLVTGSRAWPDAAFVTQVLSNVAAECRMLQFRVRHGGASRGADLIAHNWCAAYPVVGMGLYVVEEVYRASWAAHGRAAGMWRNRRMADDGADLCLAFIKDNSPGATHCANYAEKTGIPVRRFVA